MGDLPVVLRPDREVVPPIPEKQEGDGFPVRVSKAAGAAAMKLTPEPSAQNG